MRTHIHTVRHPRVSLWQSSVTEVAHGQLTAEKAAAPAGRAGAPGAVRVEDTAVHPMVRGAALHAHRHERGESVPRPEAAAAQGDDAEVARQAHLSHLHYEMAEARRTWNPIRWLIAFLRSRRYSTGDLLGWASCVTTYLAYYDLGLKKPNYRDWKEAGGGDPSYGVIRAPLPRNAKIGIVGDWGTGMPDAVDLLQHMVEHHQVDLVIHLGDVYYAGTPKEARRNVDEVIERVREATRRPLPFLTIPGNHDYYANATGFLQTIDGINTAGEPRADEPLPGEAWRQRASYFCLRTEGGGADGWQILGMDTGINDRHPLGANPNPALRPSEVEWHRDKLRSFAGRTILMSHHQVFSASSKVNPQAKAGQASPPNVNQNLLGAFQEYLEKKVVAWFWGHEHNLAVFGPVEGVPVARGRLLGSSSFEMYTESDPYKVNYPGVPYRQPMVELKADNGYYNHGYAVIDLADELPEHPAQEPGRREPARATVRYCQFPSWGHSIYCALSEDERLAWHRDEGQIGFEVLEAVPAAVAG